MLSPVVVGVDGSAESLAAAEWAAHEAMRRGRALRLLHARSWHPGQERAEIAQASERHLARRVLREAEERVRAVCPEVPLHDEQVAGPATAALVAAADDADLLVLGSRGLGASPACSWGRSRSAWWRRPPGPSSWYGPVRPGQSRRPAPGGGTWSSASTSRNRATR
ncbi:universal stress protein [Streptomyces sp. INA 01156]